VSQENVEVAKQAIDAFNRRDIDAMLVLYHRDVEVDWSASRGVEAGVYKGMDTILPFFQAAFDAFEEVDIVPDCFIDAGESVVVPNVTRSRGREGIEVFARSAFVFTFRRGRVIRVCLYQEKHEAFEAVGPSE
jgi:ketosteroid isomerase-like protein